MDSHKYISTGEAALVLGVGTKTVDRLIRTGVLPRYRLNGRYVRVREGDVRELLDVPRELLMMA